MKLKLQPTRKQLERENSSEVKEIKTMQRSFIKQLLTIVYMSPRTRTDATHHGATKNANAQRKHFREQSENYSFTQLDCRATHCVYTISYHLFGKCFSNKLTNTQTQLILLNLVGQQLTEGAYYMFVCLIGENMRDQRENSHLNTSENDGKTRHAIRIVFVLQNAALPQCVLGHILKTKYSNPAVV